LINGSSVFARRCCQLVSDQPAGAAMIPSSQAILMETFPPEEQQMAMALWGMGLMVAPAAQAT
jgi:DHA2 family multidrug resistance protein